MSQREAITEEVRALASLDLEGLRAEWRRRGCGRPPRIRSVEILGLMLAWRIQAGAWGGLDAATRRRLRSGTAVRVTPMIQPGTVFSREFRGVMHRVTAVEGGYLWKDRTYPSLSNVAFAISGVKRSGPVFFGLKDKPHGA